MNKRILFVVTQGHWGGAQRYTADLVEFFSHSNKVMVAVGENGKNDDLQRKSTTPGIDFFNLKYLVRSINPTKDVLAVFELVKIYNKQRPDIVHLNSSKAGFIGSLAKIFSNHKPKIVYTVHGWIFNESGSVFKKLLYRFLEKFSARFKDKIIVLSKSEYEQGRILGIKENKLALIKLGLNCQVMANKSDARARIANLTGINITDKYKWVITTANLYATKGIDLLIDAVAKNKDRLNMVNFVVAGDGPERTRLEKKIKENKLENQFFLPGFIENISSLLTAFNLFILPSRKEGAPYAIMEAICAGLPIIASDLPSIKELAGNSANYVHSDQPDEFAQTILNINNFNLQTKSFPLEEMTKNTLAIYDELTRQ